MTTDQTTPPLGPQSNNAGAGSKWEQLLRGIATVLCLLVGSIAGVLVSYYWFPGVRPSNKPVKWVLLILVFSLLVFAIMKTRFWIAKKKAILTDAISIGMISFLILSYIILFLCWVF